MATDDIGLEILLPDECLQRLSAHTPKVGLIAVIHEGRPLVLPVNYAMLREEVVFRTGRGAKLAAATAGAAVAFEADAIDASWEEGWSVVVHGHGHLVSNADEFSRFDDLPLRPWVPAERAPPHPDRARAHHRTQHRSGKAPAQPVAAMGPVGW